MSDQAERMRTAIRAMEFLSLIYPGSDLPAESVEARCVLLAEIEPDLLSDAVKRCAKTCKFMPTPAEVFEAARQIAREDLPTADEAWDWAIEWVGSSRPPMCPHPIARNALMAVGGGAGWLVQDRDWHRKEYVKAYEALVARELVDYPSGHLLDEPAPTPRVSSGRMESIGIGVAGVLGSINPVSANSVDSEDSEPRE